MKKIGKITLGLVVLSLFIIGCATTISDESLSLRKASVSDENAVNPDKVEYAKAIPGESKVIQRSFDNAPPLIPHSVEGLIPIKIGENACLGCHMPSVAKSMNATAIPASHFINFRPTEVIAKDGRIMKKGKVVAKSKDYEVFATKTDGKLYGGRYNCTQCHVPQSNAKPLVANNFTPDFKSKDGVKKSSLANDFAEGVNTVK